MHALLFLAAAAAGCGLWLGKNAVLAENPTYPLLYDVFGGRTRTPDKDRQWTRVHAPQPDAAGRRYSLAQLADHINLVTVRTPWASLALLPLAVAAWLVTLAGRASGGPSQRLLVAGTLWLAFVLAAWWLTTHRIDRFLVPVIPVVALAAGLGAVASPSRAWRSTTFALLAVSLLVHFPLVTQPSAGDTRFFAPLEALRRDVPEENRLPHERWYGHRVDPAHRWLNDHVPPGKRVLLVGDAQPFDLVPEAIYNTCFDDCQFTAIFRGRTRAERLAALQREKVTHVFIHWGELARFRSPGNYGYPSDYPTRELVHRELVAGQKLLRPIVLDDSANEATELFEVASE